MYYNNSHLRFERPIVNKTTFRIIKKKLKL